MKVLLAAFTPNNTERSWSTRQLPWIFMGLLVAAFWLALPSTVVPSPLGVVGALPHLWFEAGLGQEILTSLSLNIEATGLMVAVSLLVAYSSRIPALRPLSVVFSAGRFNSFVGLPFLLTLLIADAHTIKVILLATAMSVFAVPSIVDIINNIPQEKFEDARVLRMSEWRVTWEVVVLGRIDEVIDVLRTQWAMGWMVTPMVEGIFRSEGGMGVLLLAENKYLHLDSVYCLILIVCLAGWMGDQFIGQVKRMLCPYAFLGA